MKVEVDVLGSPSLIVPYGLCGRKATLNERTSWTAWQTGITFSVLECPKHRDSV